MSAIEYVTSQRPKSDQKKTARIPFVNKTFLYTNNEIHTMHNILVPTYIQKERTATNR